MSTRSMDKSLICEKLIDPSLAFLLGFIPTYTILQNTQQCNVDMKKEIDQDNTVIPMITYFPFIGNTVGLRT